MVCTHNSFASEIIENFLLILNLLYILPLLFDSGNKKDALAFGWTERYKVAVGVAEALDYLHREKAQPVIHRDVKSSNILLSDDFEPQVRVTCFAFEFCNCWLLKNRAKICYCLKTEQKSQMFMLFNLDFSAIGFWTR